MDLVPTWKCLRKPNERQVIGRMLEDRIGNDVRAVIEMHLHLGVSGDDVLRGDDPVVTDGTARAIEAPWVRPDLGSPRISARWDPGQDGVARQREQGSGKKAKLTYRSAHSGIDFSLRVRRRRRFSFNPIWKSRRVGELQTSAHVNLFRISFGGNTNK